MTHHYKAYILPILLGSLLFPYTLYATNPGFTIRIHNHTNDQITLGGFEYDSNCLNTSPPNHFTVKKNSTDGWYMENDGTFTCLTSFAYETGDAVNSRSTGAGKATLITHANSIRYCGLTNLTRSKGDSRLELPASAIKEIKTTYSKDETATCDIHFYND